MEINRGTKWSITLNNPTDHEWSVGDRPGWSIEGQLEKGKEGTLHYQGILTTPKLSFGTIKAAYPRAHIERARNAAALTAYVHKADSRVAVVPSSKGPPSLFAYQHEAAAMILSETDAETFISKLDQIADEIRADLDTEFLRCPKDNIRKRNSIIKRMQEFDKEKEATRIFMEHLDFQITQAIADGRTGLEYIASNPMWITAWRKYWRAMLRREERVLKAEKEIPTCIIEDDTTETVDEESSSELHGEDQHDGTDDEEGSFEEETSEGQGDTCTESSSESSD